MGVDVLTSAILRFGDRTSTFTCGIRAAEAQWVTIVGREGRITLTSPFNPPPEGSEVHVWRDNRVPGDPPDEVLRMGRADQYTLQAEAFAATVLDGAPPHLSLEDSIANMEVIERVVAAAG
jgi:predicted dehydrogenase